MLTNDVLRSIRYIIQVNDAKLLEIAELAGGLATPEEMVVFLKSEDEEGYEPCPDEFLACFLDGLIIFQRGADPLRPKPPIEVPVTNNIVLKKLRVAFQLKDTDIIELMDGISSLGLSKAEIGAFFRSPLHSNYRECGDQFLRNFLRALTPGALR